MCSSATVPQHDVHCADRAVVVVEPRVARLLPADRVGLAVGRAPELRVGALALLEVDQRVEVVDRRRRLGRVGALTDRQRAALGQGLRQDTDCEGGGLAHGVLLKSPLERWSESFHLIIPPLCSFVKYRQVPMGDGDQRSARPRRPTIRQLAEHTGLSPAAVSYALRGLQVSEETQARVQAAAEELGFRTDPIARALRGGATASVGMVVGSLADLYLQELVAGVQRHLRAGGRQLLIADADGDPALEVGLALELYDRRVDALIVSPIEPFAEGWKEVAERVPTVSIGERMPGADTAGQVLFDNERAVRAVLEHLAERGHRRIGVLSWAIERAPARSAEQAVQEWSQAPRAGDAAARLRVQPQRRAAARSRPADGSGAADGDLRALGLGRARGLRGLPRARPAHTRRRRSRRLRRPARLAPARPAADERALAHRPHRRDRRPAGDRRERGGGAGAHGDRPAGSPRAWLDRIACPP